jgi:hypothetical protein
MALQLKRPEVAAKYEATVDEDLFVHVGCYSGHLSNINECGAAQLVQTKSPYLVEKPVSKTTTAKA